MERNKRIALEGCLKIQVFEQNYWKRKYLEMDFFPKRGIKKNKVLFNANRLEVGISILLSD